MVMTANIKKNGFVLPLAIIIVSMVLVISITVSTLIIGELEFSSFGRDSQKAFFASDAGAECALYWDLKMSAFGTSTLPSLPISCANIADQPITPNPTSPGIFDFSLSFSNGSCVYVTVDKSAAPATILRSRGRSSCLSADTRKVERALKVQY